MPNEPKLGEKEFEVAGKVISSDNTVRLSFKTIAWIVGAIFSVISSVSTWAYFDLRGELKAAATISASEKREFLEEIEDEYDTKLDEMLREVYEIKGDVKVILDREARQNSYQPNANVEFQPVVPPSNSQPPGN